MCVIRRYSLTLVCLTALLNSAFAQELDTAVLSKIDTGEDIAKLEQPRVKRQFVVKKTFRQKVGNRSVTVQEVEPPAEEFKPESNQSLRNQVIEQIPSDSLEVDAQPKLIVLSATVYGTGKDTRSRITLWNGNQKCVAISRADFRIMSGFTHFKVDGRPYLLIENIIDADVLKDKKSSRCSS